MTQPDIWGFSADDARVLKQIAQAQGLRGDNRISPGDNPLRYKYLCYLAKVGSEAITARDGTTPGEGNITLQTINDDGTIEDYQWEGTTQTRDVLNYHDYPSGKNVYVWVGFDTFGKLFVVDMEPYAHTITFRLFTPLTTSTFAARATIFEQDGQGCDSPYTGAGAIVVVNLPRDDGGYEYHGRVGAYGRAAHMGGNRYRILSLQCPQKGWWCCCGSSSSGSSDSSKSSSSQSSLPSQSSISYTCNPLICGGTLCSRIWSYSNRWELMDGCPQGCDCPTPARDGYYYGEVVEGCCGYASSSSYSSDSSSSYSSDSSDSSGSYSSSSSDSSLPSGSLSSISSDSSTPSAPSASSASTPSGASPGSSSHSATSPSAISSEFAEPPP